MLRPHVKVNARSSWALGWTINHTAAGEFISHGGGNPGYTCFVAGSVDRKSGYAMTNSEHSGFTEVIAQLINSDPLAGVLEAKLEV